MDKLQDLPDEVEVFEDNDLIDYYLNLPYKMDDFTWCVGSFDAVKDFLGIEVEKEFINKRVKKGIHCDALIFDESKDAYDIAGTDKLKLRETKFIGGYNYPLEFSYLFGDTYLNFYRDAEGNIKTLMAQSPDLARAKLIQCQMLWKSTCR